VKLHFQEPDDLSITGGDVTLTEWMLMVGFRFPFPAIARELVVQLGVAPSQVKPNGWKYLFASYIIWRIELQKRMSIAEFLMIYHADFPSRRHCGIYRPKEAFIYLTCWEVFQQQGVEGAIFRVSSQWERAESSFFPEDQRVPREWAHMRAKSVEQPQLTDEQTDNVDAMIAFSKVKANEDKLDFNWLVTNENVRSILGYKIPISEVPYLKVRKGKS